MTSPSARQRDGNGKQHSPLDTVLGKQSLHCTHHPLHHEWNVDEEFLAHSLGVVPLEHVDDLGRRGLDLGGLAEEGDGKIIVDGNSFVWVRSLAIVGNGLVCGIEVELFQCKLHLRNAPTKEAIGLGQLFHLEYY